MDALSEPEIGLLETKDTDLDKSHVTLRVDKEESPVELYESEDSVLDNYECDNTFIINYKYLDQIQSAHFKEDPPYDPPTSIEWYPFCNSYYNYTEDVDFINRVNNFLASKPSFDSLKSVQKIEDVSDEDPYSINESQIHFLNSNPVCFLILGKPGIGESELGRHLADDWRCCYIDPQMLIEEEIEASTRVGQCIEFNLRCGRAIGVDVILRLLNKRLGTQTAQHTGFVISGFPLIANQLYEEDPVSSESAVFTVHEIFEEVLDATIDIGIAPQVPKHVSMASKASKDESEADEEEAEEEQQREIDPAEIEGEDQPPANEQTDQKVSTKAAVKDLGSAEFNICAYDEIGTSYEDQIAYIFSLCNMPLLLIYISCPNSDVVERRLNNRYDVNTKEVTNLQRARAEKVVYTVFTKDPAVRPDSLDINLDQDFVLQSFDNNMLLPYDFPANVSTTLEIYRLQVLRHIENRALIHDPQYFIKLDGRYFPHYMFTVLRAKISTLPVNYVVVPANFNDVPQDPGPEEPLEAFDPDMNTVEDCFLEFHNKMIVGKMFKWSLSNWGYHCPVALAQGRYVTGLGKYAVHFMNKIFFMSDEDAYKKFTRNPRKYLTPPYPKPNCRIFVIGPKHSAKTAVSKCLAYLLNGQYVSPKQIEFEYMKKKQSEFEDMIRSVAINESLKILTNERQVQYEKLEEKRIYDLDNFGVSFKDDVMTYEKLIAEYKVLMEETDETSSFAIAMKKRLTPSEVVRKNQIEAEVLRIRNHFAATYKLSIDDAEFRRKVLEDDFNVTRLIPRNLTTPTKMSDEVIDVHHPFVVEYINKAIDNSKMLSTELQTNILKEVFRDALTDIEAANAELGIAAGGWIVDGMPINLDLFDTLKPDLIADDIIVLKDNADHAFLLERFFYKGRNDFNDYRSFFMELGKRDAAWRSPEIVETDSFKVRLVQLIIDELLDTGEAEQPPDIDYRAEYFGRHPSRPLIKEYEEHLNAFDAKYEAFIQYMTEYGNNIIEIDITNKEIPTLLKEVVKIMDDKFRQEVVVQTPEDKIQETEDFGGDQTMAGEQMGAEEETGQPVDTFTINRRLGDTNSYCPVAFHDFNVLWRGKDELSVSFEKKIYQFASEDAMNAFIADPNNYVLQRRPAKLPPARIAIVGVPGSGKTTICHMLRQNYGMRCFDFEDALKSAIDPALFQEYLNEEDVELPEHILSDVLTKYFVQEPWKTSGIILCGFPRRPSDVPFMVRHGVIPDIIVELSCLQIEIYNRRMDKLLADWKMKMEHDQRVQDDLNRRTFAEWEVNREARMQELVKLRRDERYFNKGPHGADTDHESTGTLDDKVSVDSVQDAEDLDEIIRTLDVELPEPVFSDDWESSEEAVQRFEGEISGSYGLETTFNAALREACEIEQIPWALVDANAPTKNVLNQILRVADHIKFRNDSLLERCYDVTLEIAEKLMQSGYHFISRFGRTCPVQVFEEDNFVQLFYPLQGLSEIFPVIYRNYIYFLAGKKNRLQFMDNPIKYVSQVYKKFPLVSFRVAIIGPPKCGKTTLAERFERDLGFKAISVGSAARFILKTLSYTKLAKDMQAVLRRGWELTPEMAANCVRAMVADSKCITQGFVLDGFPNTEEEAKQLAELGIMPHLILDIDAPTEDVMRCLGLDKGKHDLPRFSKGFISYRFAQYDLDRGSFRGWLDMEYQNIRKIRITPCKWGVWDEAFTLTSAAVSEMKHYYRNAGKDMALNLSYMLVSPLEFLERQHANFKNNCPACQQVGKNRSGGHPPDRTGVVQFKKFFYWVCSEHIEDFRNTPEMFLPPWNSTKCSDEVPKILTLTEKPADAFNQGCCVVCFEGHLPLKVMEEGQVDYACEFHGNAYLFDTKTCLDRFLLEPLAYYCKSNDIHEPAYPSLEQKSLPTLGLLQQYVANQLIRAVANVSLIRPVVPGLSISQAAVIHAGLFLKLHNPKTEPDHVLRYQRALELFDGRAQALVEDLDYRKKYLNPYLWYEEPLPERLPEEGKPPGSGESSADAKTGTSGASSMIGLIDEMLDRIQYSNFSLRSD